eukprot:740123-Pleurochrysis_carterae.AAC.1
MKVKIATAEDGMSALEEQASRSHSADEASAPAVHSTRIRTRAYARNAHAHARTRLHAATRPRTFQGTE